MPLGRSALRFRLRAFAIEIVVSHSCPPILPARRLSVAARFQAADGPEYGERGGSGGLDLLCKRTWRVLVSGVCACRKWLVLE